MGISVEKFLSKYFSPKQLKEALSDMGIPVGVTKKVRIERILENWTTYHRDWYELLIFLEWGDLSRICDDFGIPYSEYNTENKLREKIEDDEVIDFRKVTLMKSTSSKKPTKNDSKNLLKNKKNNSYILLAVALWLVIGITISLLNISGYFVPTHDETVKISKEYMVYTGGWSDENTYSGIAQGMNLHGEIIFHSTLFSAQNPINVQIELVPKTSPGLDDDVFLEYLPKPVSVFFVGATSSDDKIDDEKNVSRIILEKSPNTPKLTANANLIYSQGGTHEIHVTDPRENVLMQRLLTVNEPPGAIVLFPVPKLPTEIGPKFDENGNSILVPERIEHTENSKPFFIDIKQSDALNSLESDKQNAFTTWLAITFAPLGIVITILFKKQTS